MSGQNMNLKNMARASVIAASVMLPEGTEGMKYQLKKALEAYSTTASRNSTSTKGQKKRLKSHTTRAQRNNNYTSLQSIQPDVFKKHLYGASSENQRKQRRKSTKGYCRYRGRSQGKNLNYVLSPSPKPYECAKKNSRFTFRRSNEKISKEDNQTFPFVNFFKKPATISSRKKSTKLQASGWSKRPGPNPKIYKKKNEKPQFVGGDDFLSILKHKKKLRTQKKKNNLLKQKNAQRARMQKHHFFVRTDTIYKEMKKVQLNNDSKKLKKQSTGMFNQEKARLEKKRRIEKQQEKLEWKEKLLKEAKEQRKQAQSIEEDLKKAIQELRTKLSKIWYDIDNRMLTSAKELLDTYDDTFAKALLCQLQRWSKARLPQLGDIDFLESKKNQELALRVEEMTKTLITIQQNHKEAKLMQEQMAKVNGNEQTQRFGKLRSSGASVFRSGLLGGQRRQRK